jgi:hypothetical protein
MDGKRRIPIVNISRRILVGKHGKAGLSFCLEASTQLHSVSTPSKILPPFPAQVPSCFFMLFNRDATNESYN